MRRLDNPILLAQCARIKAMIQKIANDPAHKDIGAFDDEPATVAVMDAYLAEHGYQNDFSDSRLHHEIYLTDARKAPPEKWKTVIRHPIIKSK